MVFALANFDFDEENGIIRDKLTGERCLVVYQKGLESVFKGLSEIFKAGIEALLLKSGSAAGKQIIDSARKGGKIDIKLLLSAYAKRFSQNGLGRLEVSELNLEEARMTIRVWNNIFAEMRDKESTYCSYMIGLLSGMYEGLLHASPKVKETKCFGFGDPYCEFLLTLKTP
jgi:predicted hydrocarbon binding protein